VGIHDNFFQLGGDSILSLQVVSLASQAGLQITTRQIFEHQTIAALAAVAGTVPTVVPDQGPVTGELPLTPIQQWFFEQEMPDPHHYNQAVLLAIDGEIDLNVLRCAVGHLLVHHDALRVRFERHRDGWRQVTSSPGGDPPVLCLDLSSLPKGRRSAELATAASELQASLDLDRGPLMRVASFRLAEGISGRLLLILHHLVVDGVSWRILLSDLQTVCEQLANGIAVALPAKTTSYKSWAERLVQHAASAVLDRELPYWKAPERQVAAGLPRDGAGDNSVASADSVSVELPAAATSALLHEVPQAYRTQINDVLLTALAQSFAGWTGERSLLVELEGHGREEILDGADLSRTVGWFTALFPVLLSLEDAADPGRALMSVKEQLRRVPERGIGYGLLRYLAGTEGRLRSSVEPEVSFNYLGQLDAAIADGPFRPAAEPVGPVRSPRQRRRYPLEITGGIVGGRLRMDFIYSRNLHDRTTVERLASGFRESLLALIDHCRSPWARGVTPSDFPLVELSQEQLTRAIRQVEQASG